MTTTTSETTTTTSEPTCPPWCNTRHKTDDGRTPFHEIRRTVDVDLGSTDYEVEVAICQGSDAEQPSIFVESRLAGSLPLRDGEPRLALEAVLSPADLGDFLAGLGGLAAVLQWADGLTDDSPASQR